MDKEEKKDQHKRFIEAARDAGASEDEPAFDDMLKRVTSAPPPKTVQDRKSSKKKAGK